MKKFLFLSLLISPYLVKAQAFSTGYVGEKSNGMGGAGTGIVLDASSAGTNPGSISFLNGNSIIVGGAVGISNIAYLDANNNTLSRSKNGLGTPFHLGYAFGTKDSSSFLSKFKFAIGATTPYGGDIRWDKDWTGKFSIVNKKLVAIAVASVVSYKISDKLSLGGSFVASHSTLHVQNAVPVSPDANVVMDFKSRGFGFGGGIFYKPTEKLSLGLSYVSQVNNKSYEGKAVFTVPSSLADQFPSGDVSTKSSVPQIISLGTGYKLNDKLLLAFDINYSVWKCFDSTIFVFEAATSTSAVSSIRIPNEYKNTVSLRLGAQYKITDKITARAGTSFEQTPIPSENVYPETPDANRINLTAGGSYVLNKHFSVDLSYRFVNLMKRSSTNKYSNMSGTYKTYAHVTGLTVVYNF